MAEEDVLRRAGYRVVTAYSGESALEILEEDDSISLVLMDIDLGQGLDGTETAQRILNRRELPIVFLTNHVEEEVVEKVKGITRYGYVLKDSGEFVLLETIGTAVALFQAHCDTATAESRFRHILSDFEGAAVQGYRADGTTVYWNRVSERLYQYSAEEALGKKLWDLIIPEEMVDQVKAALEQMLRTGKAIEPEELRLVRKDGSVVPVYSSHSLFTPLWGEPEFYCLDIDLTPTSLARARLQDLNQVFSALGTDPQENIRIIVRETCRIMGSACSLYNKLQDKGSSLCTWAGEGLPPDYETLDAPDGHICYEATMKSWDAPVILPELKGTRYEQSDPNVTRYGLRSYLGYPIQVDGDNIGALCIVDTCPRNFNETDLHIIATLAKGIELEEQRNQSEESIQHLLEEKELLLREAYHRIKNDLSILKSMLSMQASRTVSEQAGESLQTASQRVAVVSQVYDRLMIKEGVQRISLKRLIEDFAAEFEERYSEISVDFSVSAEEVDAPGRVGIMTGIILNELVTNSIKNRPPGGDLLEVALELERTPREEIWLRVTDSGAGFPAEVAAGENLGLGLELVRALAQQYKGELRLENVPGARASVRLRI